MESLLNGITSAEAAQSVFRGLMTADVEEFWALALGPTKKLLQTQLLFRGTVDACLVHPRDVFRFACRHNASSLIVAHNHPSQDPRPSQQDLAFTRQLIRASRMMEIPLLDHLILTQNSFSSLAREGYCRFPKEANGEPSATGLHDFIGEPRQKKDRAATGPARRCKA